MHAPSFDDRPYDPTLAQGGHAGGQYERQPTDGPTIRYPAGSYESGHASPVGHTGAYATPAPAARPRATSPLAARLRDPRQRGLLLGAGALLLLLLLAAAWYGSPTNRARRDLATANSRILDKQQEVDDARRLLERRLAELRAVRAEADVQATVYRGVLEREQRPEQRLEPRPVTSSAVGGEVALPPAAPGTGVAPNVRP